MHCPKCDREMQRQDAEPDVDIVGGWVCDPCEQFVPEWDQEWDQYADLDLWPGLRPPA